MANDPAGYGAGMFFLEEACEEALKNAQEEMCRSMPARLGGVGWLTLATPEPSESATHEGPDTIIQNALASKITWIFDSGILEPLTRTIDPSGDVACHGQGEREIPVTAEMIAAGRRGEGKPPDWSSCDGTLAAIYRAMHAAAPVELISNGERIWHTRALIAEGRVADLEGMKDERDKAITVVRGCNVEYQDLMSAVHDLDIEIESKDAQILTLRAELQAAHDLLAQRPPPAATPEPAPPILSAIRPRAVDQRRIGG